MDEEIIIALIAKISKLEERVKNLERLGRVNETEVISDFGQITNPYPNQLVYNKTDGTHYYYDAAKGWV
jgi:hypothetical protein